MGFAAKIVVHCKTGHAYDLDELVEQFIADGVKFVAVVGIDCARVEDLIDELVVGDGSDESRHILTSSHPWEPLEEVLAFARSISDGGATEPQVIDI
jgi:hypothetical protein